MSVLKTVLAAAAIAAGATATMTPASAKGFGGIQASPGISSGAYGLKATPGIPSAASGLRASAGMATKPFPGGGLPHPHNPGPFPPGGWHHGSHWGHGGYWGGGSSGPGYIGVGFADYGDCEIVRKRVMDDFGNVYVRRVRVCS